MILEEFADRAGLRGAMEEALGGVETAQFGTNMRSRDSETPKVHYTSICTQTHVEGG